jgi:exopolyphosphatase/pppGpp-phosphohydrolase
MNQRVIIDTGSSTVKGYFLDENGNLKNLFQKTLKFKEGLSDKGIDVDKENELINLIKETKDNDPDIKIEIYATAFFRNLPDESKNKLIDKIFTETGIHFNIISADLENFYLQKALVGKFKDDEAVLLVNIGGGSTELVVALGEEVLESHNINIGVGSILEKFPDINNSVSRSIVEEIMKFVKDQLPQLNNKVSKAFYTGGELTYMKLTQYNLIENDLMQDADHPYILELNDFISRNDEIIYTMNLTELESRMPNNPFWMHGAKSCSVLAQVIFEKYGIDIIIPSDSNLVNGIVRA